MAAVPNSSGTAGPRLATPANACDCHLHIYDPAFPMPRPELRGTAQASAAEYRLLQARLGTTRAVVVQPAAYGTDNAVTLDAIARLGTANARGVGVVHPGVGDAELEHMHRGGIRGLRFTQHDPRTAVTTADMIEPLARRTHELGWHTQLHLRAEQIVALAATIERLPGTLVIDHMARLPQPAGLDHPAFALVQRWLGEGRTWVKLSGLYLDTRVGPPGYADASAVARELVRCAPERVVWGSDWPHPTEKDKPDDAGLLDLLSDWAGSEARRRRILVDNPAVLYGFPSA